MGQILHKSSIFFCLLPLVLPLPGCGGVSPPDRNYGSSAAGYLPGAPGFDLECIPSFSDKSPGLDLYLAVRRSSLSYGKATEGFVALVEVETRLLERNRESQVQDEIWTDTSRVEEYWSTQNPLPVNIRRHMSAPPGSYVLEVRLTDLRTLKVGVRARSILIPQIVNGRMSIGGVVLRSADAKGIIAPVVTNDIPAGSDSLQATAEMYALPEGCSIEADIRVGRIKADTSVALPPTAYSIMPVPVGYGVIDFGNVDTVLTDHRSARSPGTPIMLNCRLSGLREGLHWIEYYVRVRNSDMSQFDTVLLASRSFSIRKTGHPRPTTLTDLIGPLAYVATIGEMKTITSATSPEERRLRFDRFWLSLLNDQRAASTLIRHYYGRVEEANRLFTTYKEGWKTDRGMVYIILGPPGNVERLFDTETWYYDITGDYQANRYVFKRVIFEGAGFVVEDYFLYRSGYYEILWDRMVSRWRSGEAW